jgi:hypothetical protein
MDRIFAILGNVTSLFSVKRETHVPEDPTLYQVITNQHQYAGKILFQDGVIIKLKIDEMKVVKILKENIRKISIHKQVTVDFN